MRDIDEVIEFVRTRWNASDTIRQVIVNRLEPRPTQEELERAKEQLYPRDPEDAKGVPYHPGGHE